MSDDPGINHVFSGNAVNAALSVDSRLSAAKLSLDSALKRLRKDDDNNGQEFATLQGYLRLTIDQVQTFSSLGLLKMNSLPIDVFDHDLLTAPTVVSEVLGGNHTSQTSDQYKRRVSKWLEDPTQQKLSSFLEELKAAGFEVPVGAITKASSTRAFDDLISKCLHKKETLRQKIAARENLLQRISNEQLECKTDEHKVPDWEKLGLVKVEEAVRRPRRSVARADDDELTPELRDLKRQLKVARDVMIDEQRRVKKLPEFDAWNNIHTSHLENADRDHADGQVASEESEFKSATAIAARLRKIYDADELYVAARDMATAAERAFRAAQYAAASEEKKAEMNAAKEKRRVVEAARNAARRKGSAPQKRRQSDDMNPGPTKKSRKDFYGSRALSIRIDDDTYGQLDVPDAANPLSANTVKDVLLCRNEYESFRPMDDYTLLNCAHPVSENVRRVDLRPGVKFTDKQTSTAENMAPPDADPDNDVFYDGDDSRVPLRDGDGNEISHKKVLHHRVLYTRYLYLPLRHFVWIGDAFQPDWGVEKRLWYAYYRVSLALGRMDEHADEEEISAVKMQLKMIAYYIQYVRDEPDNGSNVPWGPLGLAPSIETAKINVAASIACEIQFDRATQLSTTTFDEVVEKTVNGRSKNVTLTPAHRRAKMLTKLRVAVKSNKVVIQRRQQAVEKFEQAIAILVNAIKTTDVKQKAPRRARAEPVASIEQIFQRKLRELLRTNNGQVEAAHLDREFSRKMREVHHELFTQVVAEERAAWERTHDGRPSFVISHLPRDGMINPLPCSQEEEDAANSEIAQHIDKDAINVDDSDNDDDGEDGDAMSAAGGDVDADSDGDDNVDVDGDDAEDIVASLDDDEEEVAPRRDVTLVKRNHTCETKNGRTRAAKAYLTNAGVNTPSGHSIGFRTFLEQNAEGYKRTQKHRDLYDKALARVKPRFQEKFQEPAQPGDDESDEDVPSQRKRLASGHTKRQPPQKKQRRAMTKGRLRRMASLDERSDSSDASSSSSSASSSSSSGSSSSSSGSSS
ncbi:MAG: hypothetical protein ACOVQN_08790, partial [Exiguobacterium sp.]